VRATLALASKANFNYPADFFLSDEVLAGDLAPPPATQRHPETGVLRATLWQEPGLGVEPDPTLLQKWSLAHASIP